MTTNRLHHVVLRRTHAMRENPNILFIIIDQLRADCLFGSLAQHARLPNLRAFMQDSVTFTRHFSVTSPCGPSRASILTGQYAMNHRSVRNGAPLRHDTPNIATEMRKAGYLPMLFGYTDTSRDPRVLHPNDPALQTYEYLMPGFHEMLEMRMEMSYPWRSYLMKQGYEFAQFSDLFKPVSPTGRQPRLNDPALYSAEDSDTAFLTNSFLDTMPAYRDKGWFAHLAYLKPHQPLVAPSPYNDMYEPHSLPLPLRLDTREDECAMHPFFVPTLHTAVASFVEGFPGLQPTDDNIRTLRAIYLGLATEVDYHIGRIISFLKESDQYDNTMVVITSDHGEMLGDRHSWGKMTVYDAAYHVPLIMRVPDGATQPGTQFSHITESIDIVPTILQWVGQDVPHSMDGSSLLPFLNGQVPENWRTFSFSELDFADPVNQTVWQQVLKTALNESSLCILRDERFTLVEFAANLQPMLFDASKSGEMKNVAGRPEYADTLHCMTREMLRHRMRNMDKTLSNWKITSQGARQ